MTPGQILQKLNQEPGAKAVDFIDEAAGMPQSNGRYAASLPTDDPKQVGTHMVAVLFVLPVLAN
jgi:hypothetical protein